jgi:hypothetical protein
LPALARGEAEWFVVLPHQAIERDVEQRRGERLDHVSALGEQAQKLLVPRFHRSCGDVIYNVYSWCTLYVSELSMGTRKKRGTTSEGPARAKRYPAAATPSSARVKEPALLVRRKNFDLDQHRLDALRIALGVKTEREAIASAMEIALDVLAFERELRAGSATMFGTGGFQDVFDQTAALDFSGFPAGGRHTGGR